MTHGTWLIEVSDVQGSAKCPQSTPLWIQAAQLGTLVFMCFCMCVCCVCVCCLLFACGCTSVRVWYERERLINLVRLSTCLYATACLCVRVWVRQVVYKCASFLCQMRFSLLLRIGLGLMSLGVHVWHNWVWALARALGLTPAISQHCTQRTSICRHRVYHTHLHTYTFMST